MIYRPVSLLLTALLLPLSGCSSDDPSGIFNPGDDEEEEVASSATISFDGAASGGAIGEASFTTVSGVTWITMTFDEGAQTEGGSANVLGLPGRPSVRRYDLVESEDGQFRMEVNLRDLLALPDEDAGVATMDEGYVEFTAVDELRMTGYFAARGSLIRSGHEIEVSGEFDAVCMLASACP